MPKSSEKFEKLRKEAETLLNELPGKNPEEIKTMPSTMRELIQELEIHQIELELQNVELRSSQSVISELQREFEELYDFAPCGYLTLNAKGIITRSNLMAARFLGKERETFRHTTMSRFIAPGWDDLFLSARREAGVTGERQSVELRLKHTGEKALWVRSDIEPRRDADGVITQWRIILTDITELHQKTGELRQSLQRYKELVEHSSDMVWEVDTKGVHTYVSPNVKEVLGYEPAELIGRTLFEIFTKEEAVRLRALFEEHFASKTGMNFEHTALHKNGTPVFMETSAIAIFDAKGSLEGFRGVNRNITERKKMEEELRKKEELMIAQSRQAAMGDMIGMIAHQWRQPITVIAMAAGNLKLGIELGEEIQSQKITEAVATITKQTQNLSRTIDDFRDFFKPKHEKVQMALGSVIESTMKIIGKSLESNNITVEVEDRSETELLTYSHQLIQVFLNIIGNAKDIIKEKNIEEAKVIITVDETEDTIVTTICDNGGGIPEDAIKRLGEPYFSTKGKNGMGLGLYMSNIIVAKNLKGSLTWENRGKGACFLVTLPKR